MAKKSVQGLKCSKKTKNIIQKLRDTSLNLTQIAERCDSSPQWVCYVKAWAEEQGFKFKPRPVGRPKK